MNPVIKPVDGHAIYELTDEDRTLINRISLTNGGEDVFSAVRHHMCVMQMVSLLTTDARRDLKAEIERYEAENRAWQAWCSLPRMARGGKAKPPFPMRPDTMDDDPPCVSEVITGALIYLNDAVASTKMRNQLKKVVEDVLNTCPLKVVEEGDKVVETRDETEAYQAAERERERILEPVVEYDADRRNISFAKCLELIREAAAVFKVTEETAA